MRHYGLIGFPLSHSFSKRFFTQYFTDNSIDAEYLNFEISNISMLPGILKEHPNLAGFNVTIPYKEAVIPYMDSCDAKAAAIQAVNTVKIDRTGGKISLKGFNTDLIGFRNSILPLLKTHHKKSLVLGTGGASKAIVATLKDLSISTQLVSRETKAGVSISYSQLTEAIMQEYTVVVNTTPLGTFPKTESYPKIPYEYLTDKHLLFDLVYNPPITRFLQKGADHGASTKNGSDMLELQAMAAWRIWTEE
ncbi:MAG: shikimate dehydrogenase [Prolixibacteraceae bacterium]|jgi:shikimate dehydrogenase|nr:shikimate dehydrogenase [Prolixibacteraceae bacterium]